MMYDAINEKKEEEEEATVAEKRNKISLSTWYVYPKEWDIGDKCEVLFDDAVVCIS